MFDFTELGRPALFITPPAYLNDPGGLEALDTAADRTLAARLKFTRVKRGGSMLAVSSERDAGLSWFDYQALGVRTGVAEGVLLGHDNDVREHWLQTVVSASRASMIKLTRAAPDPLAAPAPKRRFGGEWLVMRRAAEARERLPLGDTYEATLAGFGKHTRRNLRAAAKVVASGGLAFEASTDVAPLLPHPVRTALAARTSPMGLRPSAATRLEAYVDATGRPFRTAVRAADGQVVSYCCGYFGAPSATGPATAYLLYQLNDAAFHDIGPSLLHRSLLLQWLIGRGCAELMFVHGCIGILRHACVPQPLEIVWLMRRSALAYARAALVGLVRPDASVGRLARLALAEELGRTRTAERLAPHT